MSSYSTEPEAFSANPYASPSEGDQGTDRTFAETTRLLKATRPWVFLLGIVSLLFAGLGALGSVGLAFAAAMGGGAPLFSLMAVAYVLGTLAYVVLGFWLVKYGLSIGNFGQLRNVESLNAALRAQKSFWKTAGIAFIIGVLAYIGMVIFMMVVGFENFGPEQMGENPWQPPPPQ